MSASTDTVLIVLYNKINIAIWIIIINYDGLLEVGGQIKTCKHLYKEAEQNWVVTHLTHWLCEHDRNIIVKKYYRVNISTHVSPQKKPETSIHPAPLIQPLKLYNFP